MDARTAVLRSDVHSKETLEFEKQLRAKIVGQDAGIAALVELYQIFCANLNAPNRPVGTLLFLGPTGTGKTRLVEAAAETLFGDSRAVIKVDCAEYRHSRDISGAHRFAAGIPGTQRNASAHHPGCPEGVSYRQVETEFSTIR